MIDANGAQVGVGQQLRIYNPCMSDASSRREPGCPFCHIDEAQMIATNALAFMVTPLSPATEGHLLAVPRRHVPDYFDLHPSEHLAIQRLLEDGRQRMRDNHSEVSGFNIGINCGEAAGQTVFHAHVHLIPRRVGDVEDPRGGWIIPPQLDSLR